MLMTVARPLVLDLDGTVLRTDTLVEGMLRLVSARPLTFLKILPALAAGRAAFKRRISTLLPLDPATLAYNGDVVALARSARAEGRPVYLVTAADQGVADPIAAHLGLFDGVYGSDGARNLKGPAKAEFLAERFGERGFDYAGDAPADLAVWRRAARAIVVGAGPGLLAKARGVCADAEAIGAQPDALSLARVWGRALRLHQWAKNVLVFLPVLAAHKFGAPTLGAAALAFLAYSLCASSVYVLNDLLDLPHDRAHPRKCKRPFASGALPLQHAPAAIAACLLGGFGIALLLPAHFLVILGVYYACTLTYSLGLKRRPVWDVLMLAGLYTLRVFAGSAATGIRISPWLLAFSLFLFFCLAVVKRMTELVLHIRSGRGESALSGRGYDAEDLDMLRSMGASSGYMAVLIMALYVNSPDVLPLYRLPAALWSLCPLLLFWVSRVLMLSHRGLLHDDPVVFALRDRVSLLVGAMAFAAILAGAFW